MVRAAIWKMAPIVLSSEATFEGSVTLVGCGLRPLRPLTGFGRPTFEAIPGP